IDIAFLSKRPQGLSQTLALCRVTTPDAAVWGPPLIYHAGDPVTSLNDSADGPPPRVVRLSPHKPVAGRARTMSVNARSAQPSLRCLLTVTTTVITVC